jgi:cytoskeleton protein RodZ
MSPGSIPFDVPNGPGPNGPGPDRPGSESVAVLVGRELRAARQRRAEDLYDVADLLRIKPSYLFALEEGDHTTIPGMPYLSGFLRSYAEHLGLDGQKLVRRLKGAQPAGVERSRLVCPVPASEERRPTLVIATAVLVLCGAGYGGWSYLSSQMEPPIEAVAEAPPVLPIVTASQEPARTGEPVRADPPRPSVLAAAPVTVDGVGPPVASEAARVVAFAAIQPDGPPAAREPAAATAVPAAEPAPLAPSEAAPVEVVAVEAVPVEPVPVEARATEVDEGRPDPGVGAAIASEARVVLVATEPAWIQIRSADRQFSRSRLMEAGERFLLPERADLALWTGNAGGLQVMVDGIELAPLGARGAVLKNIPLDPAALKARSAG